MRKQLNLNKYYEGLELDAINEVFSRMMDLKTNIDGLNYIYNKSEERFEQTKRWRDAKALGESSIHYQVKKIDSILSERNKETIFGITKGQKLVEEDYRCIIDKYRYLMSEPENI